MMYARTCDNRVHVDVLRAVLSARSRNFRAARARRLVMRPGWLG